MAFVKGDRKGQYSIWINDQYRICFSWKDGQAIMSQSLTITRKSKRMRAYFHSSRQAVSRRGVSGAARALRQCLGDRTEGSRESHSGNYQGAVGITADTALRLAQYLGTSAEFWMNLQQAPAFRLSSEYLERVNDSGFVRELDGINDPKRIATFLRVSSEVAGCSFRGAGLAAGCVGRFSLLPRATPAVLGSRSSALMISES
jgi:hypothetical protein